MGVSFQATRRSALPVAKEVAELPQRINGATLKLQQRLVILRQYLLPRLYHSLVLGPVTAKLLLRIDYSVRAATRRCLALPYDAPLGLF